MSNASFAGEISDLRLARTGNFQLKGCFLPKPIAILHRRGRDVFLNYGVGFFRIHRHQKRL
jgi:hypothetical protein